MATIEIDRAVVFVLVEENVTDCKAAWYWAGVSAATQSQHATRVAADDAILGNEIERIARLIVIDRDASTCQIGGVGRC